MRRATITLLGILFATCSPGGGLTPVSRVLRIRGGQKGHHSRSHGTKPKRTPSADSLAPNRDKGTTTNSYEHLPSTRRVQIALGLTYMTIMAAKVALPTVLPLLPIALSFPPQHPPSWYLSRLLTTSTLAVAAGKLLLGPLIDAAGGTRSLRTALTLLGVALASIAGLCTHVVPFTYLWVMVDFVFSSAWAACLATMHQLLPPSGYPQAVGLLAAGARTGNMVGFWIFSHLLGVSSHASWQRVFGLAALLQVIPLAMWTTIASQSRPVSDLTQAPSPTIQKPSALEVLREQIRQPLFWLHAVSRSCLMVFASFLLFVPSLLSHVYQASPAVAARTGSLYALGCLLAVTWGSSRVLALGPRRRATALAVATGSAALCSLAQLVSVASSKQLSLSWSIVSLFLWGLCFAVPFYVPPSLFCLRHGEAAATLSDLLDVGGFALLAVFNGYVASINHTDPRAWIPTFGITTTCALVSGVSLTAATLLEEKDSRVTQ